MFNEVQWVLVLVICVYGGASQSDRYSAVYETMPIPRWTVVPGYSPSAIATATYTVQQNETGWDVIRISTTKSQPDALQATAAGYIEGYLTQQSIWNAWLGFNATNSLPPKLEDFVVTQDKWVRMNVETQPLSPYWIQVGLTINQFEGILKGYADAAPKEQQLSYYQMLLQQLGPEIDDITAYLQLTSGEKPVNSMDKPYFASHCSVLVKLSKDKQNLYAAHDTWSGYSTMLRIYKFYELNFNHPSTKSVTVAFSGYPNCIQSTDDFYITSQRLWVAETTNEILNNTLYTSFIRPQTVPEWIRIIIANRMAGSGKEWVNIFSQWNSGTYNNQWQIVDYKLFTPGQYPLPGTLWIAEQIPGYIAADDLTPTLIEQGFWPSYNVPYFQEIYDLSNYPAYYLKYGDAYSYSKCARAQIFHRDAGTVETMEDMKKIMRYNKFQIDPLSLHDACRGISARCDLNVPWLSNNTLNGVAAFGGIDSKITSDKLIAGLQAVVVSGPTWDSQPPFAWTDQWASLPSYGCPRVYDFEFINMDYQ